MRSFFECFSQLPVSGTLDQPTLKGSGGARRDRTDDLKLAKLPLSQLSYGPGDLPRSHDLSRSQCPIFMVGLGGLEPPTSRLSSARSNQLSYKPESLSTGHKPVRAGHKDRRIRRERETKTATSRKCPDATTSGDVSNKIDNRANSNLLIFLRKEVIQPQVPLRLPCYDFTPVADPTVVACLPCGLAQRLRVKPTPMV